MKLFELEKDKKNAYMLFELCERAGERTSLDDSRFTLNLEGIILNLFVAFFPFADIFLETRFVLFIFNRIGTNFLVTVILSETILSFIAAHYSNQNIPKRLDYKISTQKQIK